MFFSIPLGVDGTINLPSFGTKKKFLFRGNGVNSKFIFAADAIHVLRTNSLTKHIQIINNYPKEDFV